LNATASYKDGKTILSDKFYTQPFKIMKPFHIKKDLMTVMMQTASAGILKGDTQEMHFVVEDNAKMELLSQSFEKLHKMDGGSARRDTTIKVGKNALFKYSPLPTIPFYDSGFDSTIHAELEDDSSQLILLEVLSGGRIAYGEEFVYRFYNSHITVRKGGKLIYNDNAQYNPSEMDMKSLGMYEGFTHMATLLFINMKDKASDLEKIRGMIDENEKVEGGASIIQSGDTSVKLLGRSAQDLFDLCEKIMDAMI
jgi:urease accessory protein